MSLYTLHPNLHSSIHKSSISRTIKKKKNRNMVMASSNCRNLFVCTAALLLLFAASSSCRPDPSLPLASQYQVVEEADKVVGMEEESCEGVGEDECLMRRTLAAHIDYIYTQKHKH